MISISFGAYEGKCSTKFALSMEWLYISIVLLGVSILTAKINDNYIVTTWHSQTLFKYSTTRML